MSSAPAKRETLVVPGPAGTLEALLEVPAAARAMAVVCHPHPQHQGTMQNKVVHTLCRACHDSGYLTLRFNFRGVGQSSGAWDAGRGEVEDARAACAWLRERHGALPLLLAGFSFGAAIAIHAAISEAPARLISVAPPPLMLDEAALPALPTMPWLMIQGAADEVVSAAAVQDWLATRKGAAELVLLPGVGHFFHGQLVGLRTTVSSWLDGLAAER